jgi:hypothetical protein
MLRKEGILKGTYKLQVTMWIVIYIIYYISAIHDSHCNIDEIEPQFAKRGLLYIYIM